MGPGCGLKVVSQARSGVTEIKEAQNFSWLSILKGTGSVMESLTGHMFSMSCDCYLIQGLSVEVRGVVKGGGK